MTYNTVISYPIPAYSNVPIQWHNYSPRRNIISNVALGPLTTITTTYDMDYVVGQECRLIIPNSWGCVELNGLTAYVIDIPAPNQVVLNLNSNGASAFISSSATTKAQILAIGEINTGDINQFGNRHTGTFIPGSFINISNP